MKTMAEIQAEQKSMAQIQADQKSMAQIQAESALTKVNQTLKDMLDPYA